MIYINICTSWGANRFGADSFHQLHLQNVIGPSSFSLHIFIVWLPFEALEHIKVFAWK